MTDEITARKRQQLHLAGHDTRADRGRAHFERVRLSHRALPEVDLDQVDTGVRVLGKDLSFPLMLTGITGGADDELQAVNQRLAEAAQRTGVALGLGSQRVMLQNPAAAASFRLREHAPDVLLCANLGAIQLNHGMGARECQAVIDAAGADALCLHVNPLQEAVQLGGNTAFADLARRLGEVVPELSRPVILKEVGCGISPADAKLAMAAGIRCLDVAGAGGTSFSRIEAARNHDAAQAADAHLGAAFEDWGIPTPDALLRLRPWCRDLTLFASGGIRNGIDMAKAIVLGARVCGVAGPLVQPAMSSTGAVVDVIERLRREFTTAMFLLGAATVDDLHANDSLLLETS